MIKSISHLLLVSILVICGCSRLDYIERQTGREQVSLPRIRVRILHDSQFSLKCQGSYKLRCVTSELAPRGYYSVAELRFRLGQSGIVLSDNGFVLDSNLTVIYAAPKHQGNHLLINGKPFRGVLEVRRDDDKLELINVLNLEDYLKGVLPPEIGRLESNALEALKAQAVASRTYAYSRLLSNRNRRYDLVNSIMDQVYRGIAGEYLLATRAIEETAGMILKKKKKPITAYYHSTCGGYTEDVAHVWDKQGSRYLKGVEDLGYCSWSKYYNWHMSWQPEELAEYLRQYLLKEREFTADSLIIEDIIIKERFSSGRINYLEVKTDKGDFLFFKDQIRWAFRRPGRPELILPSSNFDLRLWRDHDGKLVEITAEGGGYGHGVGMCQCGAIGRARSGQTFREILNHYYTDVNISKIY